VSHIQGLSSSSVYAEAFANNTLTEKQKLMKASIKLRELAIRNKEQGLEIRNKELAILKKNKDLVNKVKIELKEVEEAEESIEPSPWLLLDDRAGSDDRKVVTPEVIDSDDDQWDSDDDRWGSWEGKIFPQAEVVDSDDDQWGPWNGKKIGMQSFDWDARARARAEEYREGMVKRAKEQALSEDGLKALAKKKAKDKARAMDEARSRAKALSQKHYCSSSNKLVQVKQELASSSSNKLVEVKQEQGKDALTELAQQRGKSKARPKAVAPVSKAKAKAKHVPTPPDQPPTEEHIAAAAARAEHKQKRVKFWRMLKTAEENLHSATAMLHNGIPMEHKAETIRRQQIANIDYAKCGYAQTWVRIGQWYLVQQGADSSCELLMASLRVAANARVNQLEAIILVENHKRLKAIEEMVCENEAAAKSWEGPFMEQNPQDQ